MADEAMRGWTKELEGHGLRLAPMTEQDEDALWVASEGRADEVWKHYTVRVRTRADFHGYQEDLLAEVAEGRRVAWTVREGGPEGRVLGSSSYLNVAPRDLRAEIGSTWYAPSAQGGAVNSACKLLLLTHAFETLGLRRVELKTDTNNARSRRAMEAIGATFEGIFRNHMIRHDGTQRHSAWYAFYAEEWQERRAFLEARLARKLAAAR